MMNWIWLGLILLSIIVGGLTDQMQAVTIRSFESAKEAVWLAFKLIGIMAFWLGVMKVAEHSGLMRTIARLLRRPMRWLFPDVPENHPAMSAMIMNFGANIMGLANAATPFGILAMVELAKLNKHKGTASDAMCLFLAINTSSLTLLATGTIGLRAAAGSVDPAGIWLPSLAASACATLVGIASAKLLQRMIRFRLPELPAGSLAPEGAGSADELLDLHPRRGADLLYERAPLADHHPLLRLALHHDARPDASDIALPPRVLELIDLHRRRVRYLLAHLQKELLAYDLGGQKPHRVAGVAVLGEEGLPLRQALLESPDQLVHTQV